MTTWAVRVSGAPVPQGSMTCVGWGGRHQVVDEKRKVLKPWRDELIRAGHLLMERHGLELIEGPVEVTVTFTVQRPASVKPAARPWPSRKATGPDAGGDLDKLQRAVGDGWAGVVFRDDSQICRWVATKTYSDGPAEDRLPHSGAVIRVSLL